MKTNYLFLTLFALALTACDGKDEPEYAPADVPAEARRVHFAEPSMTRIVDAGNTTFDVYLYRPDNPSAGELTVQLTVTDPSGLFTFPQAVTFAAGKSMTPITVGYDVSAMTPNTPYETYIAVDQANADLYGETTLELTINYEVMTEWALFGAEPGTAKDGLGIWTLGSIFEGNVFEGARVMERHVPTNPDVMEYTLQLYDGEDIEQADPTAPYDDEIWLSVMTFSTTDGGKTITVPVQTFVLEPSLQFADAHSLLPDNFQQSSYWDDAKGTFVLNIMYFDAAGPWNPGDETIALNGYVDTNDYTLTVTDLGQTTVEGKDYTLIGFRYSPNALERIDYTIVPTGKDKPLTTEEIKMIAEVIADPDQTEYEVASVAKPGNVVLTFDASDSYTLVAIGYNAAGEVKATATCEFTYTAADAPATDGARAKFMVKPHDNGGKKVFRLPVPRR